MNNSMINLFEKKIDDAVLKRGRIMISVRIGDNSIISETELDDYFYDNNFIVLNKGNSSYSFDINTLSYTDDYFTFGDLISVYFI